MYKILKGSTLTFGMRTGTFVINLTMMILIARALGPGGVGVYTLLVLIPTVLVSFGTPAIGTSNVYLCGTGKYDLCKIAGNSLISAVFFGVILFALAGTVSLFPQSRAFLGARGIMPILVWLAVATLPFRFLSFYFRGILRGAGNIGQFNIVTGCDIVVQFVIVVILLVGGNVNLFSLLVAYVLSALGSATVAIVFVRRLTRITFSLDWPLFQETLRYGVKAYLWNTTYFLDRRLDMILVGVMVSATELGYYSTAVGLAGKLSFLPDAVATVLFPYIAASDQEGAGELTASVSRQVLLLMSAMALFIGVFAVPLVTLAFGVEFLPAIHLLRILLPGTVLIGVARLITVSFAGRGKPEIGALSALISFVVMCALIFLLVPVWGIRGAAIAVSSGYVIATAVMVILFSRKQHVPVRDILVLKRGDRYNYEKVYALIVTRLDRANQND